MRRRACGLRAAAAIALTATIGCAPVQPPGATSVAQPAPSSRAKSASGSATKPGTGPAAGSSRGVAVGNTVSGGSIVSSGLAPAIVDSGPSADAEAVLATIPEPLSPSERIPPPVAGTGAGAAATAAGTGGATPASRAGAPGGASGGTAGAGGAAAAPGAGGGAAGAAGRGAGGSAAAAATIAAGARPDSAGGAGTDSASATAASDSLIPVPAPTQPLGERRESFARSLADTLPAAPPAAPPPPATAKAGPDTCWRIQVAAPPSKQEAELRRQAAESVLLTPFVVEHEKQRYKVRNRDCLARDAADRLRRRALQSGFAGAFPVVDVNR